MPYDVIGLSYYSFWHGHLRDLRANVNDLATRFGKDVMVAEIQYAWTLGYGDSTNNFVWDPSQLEPGYPASPDGQLSLVNDVLSILADVPGGHGDGLFYWEPEWVRGGSRGGTPNDNLTLFDFGGAVAVDRDLRIPAYIREGDSSRPLVLFVEDEPRSRSRSPRRRARASSRWWRRRWRRLARPFRSAARPRCSTSAARRRRARPVPGAAGRPRDVPIIVLTARGTDSSACSGSSWGRRLRGQAVQRRRGDRAMRARAAARGVFEPSPLAETSGRFASIGRGAYGSPMTSCSSRKVRPARGAWRTPATSSPARI